MGCLAMAKPIGGDARGFFTGYGAIPREPGGCCTGKVRVYLALPWNITVKVPGGSVTSGLWSGRGRIFTQATLARRG